MQHYGNIRTQTIRQPEPSPEQVERWQSQERIVFDAFHESPKTMFQVEVETTVMRPSICRFVGQWKKEGKIKIVRIDKDPLTNRLAQFLSTNSLFWPSEKTGIQFNLFQ